MLFWILLLLLLMSLDRWSNGRPATLTSYWESILCSKHGPRRFLLCLIPTFEKLHLFSVKLHAFSFFFPVFLSPSLLFVSFICICIERLQRSTSVCLWIKALAELPKSTHYHILPLDATFSGSHGDTKKTTSTLANTLAFESLAEIIQRGKKCCFQLGTQIISVFVCVFVCVWILFSPVVPKLFLLPQLKRSKLKLQNYKDTVLWFSMFKRRKVTNQCHIENEMYFPSCRSLLQ